MKYLVVGKHGIQIMALNRRKAIRERCMNCVGWNAAEVRRYDFRRCPLHPYRMGRGQAGCHGQGKDYLSILCD